MCVDSHHLAGPERDRCVGLSRGTHPAGIQLDGPAGNCRAGGGDAAAGTGLVGAGPTGAGHCWAAVGVQVSCGAM